jgi:D-3-phosphoglycerate dehydrogenase
MPLRCAILDDYQNVALASADWSRLGDRVAVEVFNEHLDTADDVVAALGAFDILCLMRERTALPAAVLARLPNLKLILTTGMRNVAIDVAAANARGIVVCGAGMGNGMPTAELVFAHMLEFTRRVGSENARLKAGGAWQTTIGTELNGKTLGLVGLGKLGQRVARIAKAFGMEVCAWSQNLTPEKCAEIGVRYASRDELFATSDFISIHVQLSERTHGLIGAADLARMKPTAFLINTSRGPIIDEVALLAALRDKKIAGAGLDVFAPEPLPDNHPLRGLERAQLTPHLGYVTRETYAAGYAEMVEDIEAFLGGAPIRVITAW